MSCYLKSHSKILLSAQNNITANKIYFKIKKEKKSCASEE